MIVGLTGRIASGKGEVKKYLEELGFSYCTFSDLIREEASRRGIPIIRKNLQNLGNEIRNKEGAGAWAKRIVEKIDKTKNHIIDGIRNPAEVEELRKLEDFYLIAVDAPQEIRFKRVIKRNKDSDPNDWEGFLEIDNRDFSEEDSKGQQVGKCMEEADFFMVNDGNLEEIRDNVKKVFERIKC